MPLPAQSKRSHAAFSDGYLVCPDRGTGRLRWRAGFAALYGPRTRRLPVYLDSATYRAAARTAPAWASYARYCQALELVRQQHPQAIVLDLMMPVMDGWRFLEHCRADARCAGTPVLVISAARHLPREAAGLGVKGCIAKPFDLDVLLGEVERVVRAA